MKIYNSFNEMFRNNKQNNNLSVFNTVIDDTKGTGEVDGSGYAVGAYKITAMGEPYLLVYYYGDNDIQNNNLIQNDNDGFNGVAFLRYTPNFNDYCNGDDLVETLFDRICEKSQRSVMDNSPDDAIDFDFPLTKQEAFDLATTIDSCVQDYIKRHPEC